MCVETFERSHWPRTANLVVCPRASLLTLVSVLNEFHSQQKTLFFIIDGELFVLCRVLGSGGSDGSEQLNRDRQSWRQIIWNSDEIVLCFVKKMSFFSKIGRIFLVPAITSRESTLNTF